MKTVNLQITSEGGVRMLHDDAVDLGELGKVEMSRASHVEFCNEKQAWFVQSALTLKILKDDFKTRAEALTWEKNYYSPDGEGWHELTTKKEEAL